jgi:hypothetical protein
MAPMTRHPLAPAAARCAIVRGMMATNDGRAPWRCAGFIFLCGATIAPLGDHFHVARGVTEYFTAFGPIWFGESPLWFVLLVATFMASLGLLQGRVAANDGPAASSLVFASPLGVMALYLTTSFYPWREGGSLEALVTVVAALSWVLLDRSGRGALIGIVVAVVATASEWGLVQLGVFRYLPESDELWGVAPWLLPLYFAASVAVGAVGRRMLATE